MSLVALRHWPIGRRLLLLVLLLAVAVAIPTLTVVSTHLTSWRFTQAEVRGLAPARALLQATRHLQVHRGQTAALLGGAAQADAPRQKAAEALVQSLGEARDSLARAGLPAQLVQQLDSVGQRFQALKAQVEARQIAGPDSFSQHSALVEDLLQTVYLVTRESNLLLDPEPHGRFLVSAGLDESPRIAEAAAQMRGLGSGMIAAGQREMAAQMKLAALLGQLEDHLRNVDRALQSAFDKSPAVRAQLEARTREPLATVRAFGDIVRAQLLGEAAPTMAYAEFFAAGTAAVNAQLAMTDAVSEITSVDLEARARAALWRLLSVVGGVLVLAVVATVMVWRLSRGIVQPVQRAVQLAQGFAQGDLTQSWATDRRDEIGVLMNALESARLAWVEIMRQLRHTAESVSTASGQIAAGNQDLSGRTESAASSLQQTAASVEQLTGTVRNTADSARTASQLASTAAHSAEQGGTVVADVVRNMEAIHASSRKIGDIIGVIDGIAFQTNILALNAAVEAARAGEQGRGFAVVAGEVRNLAQRSAQAAREIKSLIGASVEQVEAGTQLVRDAGTSMGDIVASVQRVSALVGEISSAAHEQSAGLSQVNVAVSSLDQATQQNAALVEESAAAAESLLEQARRLSGAVERFRLQPA